MRKYFLSLGIVLVSIILVTTSFNYNYIFASPHSSCGLSCTCGCGGSCSECCDCNCPPCISPQTCVNGVCVGPLPPVLPPIPLEDQDLVELSLFEALFSKGKVTVHWVTESEKNTAGFDIERSLKPHKDYEKLNSAMIPAEGDGLGGADYSYVDNNIKLAKYYYQLKEYELTGKTNYYGPTDIDLRPQSTTNSPNSNTTPKTEKNVSGNEDITTYQPPAVTEISGDIDITSLDPDMKKQYLLAGLIKTKTVNKSSDSPNTWIKSPFQITNKKGSSGRSYNGNNNKTDPTPSGQDTPGPAKIISWLEKANVTYVSQRNFSHKDLFIKLLENKVIVVNKTNPEYFRFVGDIADEEQLIKRLEKIGIKNMKPVLTIWRESHENKK